MDGENNNDQANDAGGNWEKGKGAEFYRDSDGTVFTTGEGGWPQLVYFPKKGWVPYDHGFDPFTTRKVDEEEAKRFAIAE